MSNPVCGEMKELSGAAVLRFSRRLAGERGEDGAFPEGSVSRRADDRLAQDGEVVMDADRDADEGGAEDPPELGGDEQREDEQLGDEADGGRDAGERTDAEAEGAAEQRRATQQAAEGELRTAVVFEGREGDALRVALDVGGHLVAGAAPSGPAPAGTSAVVDIPPALATPEEAGTSRSAATTDSISSSLGARFRSWTASRS